MRYVVQTRVRVEHQLVAAPGSNCYRLELLGEHSKVLQNCTTERICLARSIEDGDLMPPGTILELSIVPPIPGEPGYIGPIQQQ